MSKNASDEGYVYDLHITVDPETLDRQRIAHPWKVLDILNVQGLPHCIISRKYVGDPPHDELDNIVRKLEVWGAGVQRKKIEFHFRNTADAMFAAMFFHDAPEIIEVHYKYKQRGVFAVSAEQVEELNRMKLALSFNVATERVIVSARFAGLDAYKMGREGDELPPFLEEEEREIIIFDTNNGMDSFWPMRTVSDPRLVFGDFPPWILR